MSNLTQAVLLYQKLLKEDSNHVAETREDLYKNIVMTCQIIIYEYPVKVKLLQEEEAAELLLLLIPRLDNLITSFIYMGVDFEVFLTRTIFLQTSYYKQKIRQKERKYFCLYCPGDEMEYYLLSEPSFEYETTRYFVEENQPPDWSAETAISKHVKLLIEHYKAFANRFKQFVVLNAPHLTAQQIAFLAKFMEMDELDLAELVREAFELAKEKYDRTIHAQEVRNTHYVKSQFLRRELEVFEGLDAHYSTINKIKKRYLRSHTLFLERCNDVRNRPNPVTHQTLSKIFKKPKGTIDSGMSALKKALNEIVDDNQ